MSGEGKVPEDFEQKRDKITAKQGGDQAGKHMQED
jgi:hypothetical protein